MGILAEETGVRAEIALRNFITVPGTKQAASIERWTAISGRSRDIEQTHLNWELIPMKRLYITFAVFFNLYLGNTVLAEEEKQSKKEKPVALVSPKPAAVANSDIEIKVKHDGEQVTVAAEFIVPVTPQQAWAVLTDFENIPSFNSGVLLSKVTSR